MTDPSPDALVEALIAEVRSFTGGRRKANDITALVVAYHPPGRRMIPWRAARGPAIVALVTAILIWNADLRPWLGQAERQYCCSEEGGDALGEARDVTLDGSMAVAVR